MPKTNTEFWETKLSKNAQRDMEKQSDLKKLGWNVVTVWECESELATEELKTILQRRILGPAVKAAPHDLLMVAETPPGYSDTGD